MTCSTTSSLTTPGSLPMPRSRQCRPRPGGRSFRRARGCSPIAHPFLRISKHSSKVENRPIFGGFGSMPAAGDATRRLIGAARAVGRRIIVSRGWADLELIDDAPDCIAVDDVSYDVLFPRVAAVVHHGGAGTTAAAARAGVPQVITPMFGDQFYWASRIVDLGVGATTLHTTMTEESLTARTSGGIRFGGGGSGAQARRTGQQGRGGDCSEAARRRVRAEAAMITGRRGSRT